MVPSSRAAVRPDHVHTLKLPSPIEVALHDGSGAPRRILARQRWREVEAVLDSWLVETEWWRPRPVRRRYFQVGLTDGGMLTCFQDLLDARWYAQAA